MLVDVDAACALTKYADRHECSSSHLLEGIDEYATCDGSTMKTARRAIWTSASVVTSPETIASGREQAASSSTTIGRRRNSSTTRTATTAAIRVAASRESVRAAAAVKAKIPYARPRDDETNTRKSDVTYACLCHDDDGRHPPASSRSRPGRRHRSPWSRCRSDA